MLVYSDAYNVILAVKDKKWTVEAYHKLPEGTQPQISVEELALAEEVVKKDAKVQALVKEIGTPILIMYSENFPHYLKVSSRRTSPATGGPLDMTSASH